MICDCCALPAYPDAQQRARNRERTERLRERLRANAHPPRPPFDPGRIDRLCDELRREAQLADERELRAQACQGKPSIRTIITQAKAAGVPVSGVTVSADGSVSITFQPTAGNGAAEPVEDLRGLI